ncbi:MAG: hypothetical protein Q9202_003153 [Teloschistes flavicans]
MSPHLPTTLPFPLRFYDPVHESPDARGRTLSTILSWPRSRLESSHDYIQNLFPLPERSPYNPSAPIIDELTFRTFRSSKDLQNQLRHSLICMAKFYGFTDILVDGNEDDGEEGGGGLAFEPQEQRFDEASRHWLMPFNHNHLRITRIIRSCRILGLEADALAFHDAVSAAALQKLGDKVERSRMYWERAAKRPLYLAPEDDVDVGRGKDFLYRFEEERQQQQQQQQPEEVEEGKESE